jgi:hypothetical protein
MSADGMFWLFALAVIGLVIWRGFVKKDAYKNL